MTIFYMEKKNMIIKMDTRMNVSGRKPFHFQFLILVMFFLIPGYAGNLFGKEPEQKKPRETAPEPTSFRLDDVVVRTEKLKDNIEISPGEIIINLGEYKQAGVPHTILDILNDRAIFDFRGASDLVSECDDIQMRGFDTRQFTTAIDGLAVQKTGGYWGGHFVDYSIIPLKQIEAVEILPGPHSALYEGKSFGGVVNIRTKAPKKRQTPEMEFHMLNSYASLNTHDHSLTMSGGGGMMDYVVNLQSYHTDGYLKNSEGDLNSGSARLAWHLPSGGYFSLLGTYAEKVNQIPCENDPEGDYYDSDYPVVLKSNVGSRWRDPSINARREKNPHSLRFGWKQPSSLGDWTIGAYYSYEDQEYLTSPDVEPMAVTWWTSYGANIRNDYAFNDAHTLTFGFDFANLNSRYSQEVVRTYAGFLQDRWNPGKRLTLTPGIRFEEVHIWWSNWTTRGGGQYKLSDVPMEYIPKTYRNFLPSFFATYDLDGVTPLFRDTSVSFGLSRVWTPRATCEVCTWGSGVEQNPTEGYGIDLIFQRRVFKDIDMMVDFSHYSFDNYVMWADSSTDYFQNAPWGRRMVGLKDVDKNGMEIEINGNILEDLSFNLSGAYVDWNYKGPEDGGIADISSANLTDRAKYRINAGITYNLKENMQFHLDYKHQDKQVKEVVDVIDEDAGIIETREVVIDSYGVMDLSFTYIPFEKWKRITSPTLKIFVNNLLDKEYVNVSGYPATERIFGVSLDLGF